jgi:hypothetical protein
MARTVAQAAIVRYTHHRMKALCIAMAVLVGAAGLAVAHHSPTAIFDMSKPVTVTGKLTKVNWTNPHIVINVETTGGPGWVMESNPPAWFRRVGVNRADFAKSIGQQVTVECVKARDGSAYGYMQKITFPDKTSLELVVDAK